MAISILKLKFLSNQHLIVQASIACIPLIKTQQFFPDHSNTVKLKLQKNCSQTIKMNEAGDYGENSTLPKSEIILLKNYCYHKYLELKLDSNLCLS